MKRSDIYAKAIEAVAKMYSGEELIEILAALLSDLELAEWREAQAEKKKEGGE